MKELSQYKEEILKRSERKIRQRKTRRRIALGVSIPLCLCLVVSGTMFGKQLSNFKSDTAAEMAPNYAPDMEAPMEGTPLDSYLILDPGLFQDILDAPVKEQGEPENGSLKDGANDAVLDNAAPETRILWVGEEAYRLTGRTLYREATGETRVLTEEQLQQLNALLEQEVNDE